MLEKRKMSSCSFKPKEGTSKFLQLREEMQEPEEAHEELRRTEQDLPVQHGNRDGENLRELYHGINWTKGCHKFQHLDGHGHQYGHDNQAAAQQDQERYAKAVGPDQEMYEQREPQEEQID